MAIFIDNSHDLLERIDEYKQMFPDTYTDFEAIRSRLEKEELCSPGHVFGIEVSSEWPDKCYGFELDRQTPQHAFFRYVGIWKS